MSACCGANPPAAAPHEASTAISCPSKALDFLLGPGDRLSIVSPRWVHWAISFVIVPCAYIWLAIFGGAGAPAIDRIVSPRGG